MRNLYTSVSVQTVKVFANGLGDQGSISGRGIRMTQKWYLMPPCLTLSIIRYGSRVKWSNPEKRVAPSPTPWCNSYWKGSFRLILDYGRQLYFYLPSRWTLTGTTSTGYSGLENNSNKGVLHIPHTSRLEPQHQMQSHVKPSSLSGFKYYYLTQWILFNIICREVRPPNKCPDYRTKQSDGEVPVMLELWGMQSTPLLPLLPGSPAPEVVAPHRVLSMSQIELNCVLILNWTVWNGTVFFRMKLFGWLVVWVLWNINFCGLFPFLYK